MDTGKSDTGKSFELERHPGFARLALNPNLNAYQWADIERSAAEILTALESAKASGVIVDLSQLDYLGSAQLTLLVRVWKAIKAGNGRMVVLVTAPVVREVLNTAGLSNLWEFSDNLASAYQILGLRSDGGGGGGSLPLAVPIVGLAALAGLVALILKLVSLEARVALIAQLGLAGVGAAAGVWLIMRTAGMRRNLGIGIVAASAVLAVVGILRAPVGNAPPPSAEKQEESKSEPAAAGAEADATGAEKADAGKTGGAEAGDKKEDSAQGAPKSPPLNKDDE